MFESAESLLARKFEYSLQLKDAIRRLHGCESEYAGREEIMETFQDETVWNGYVEIFNISGHPQATRCYSSSERLVIARIPKPSSHSSLVSGSRTL